jgi:hypothetical protein
VDGVELMVSISNVDVVPWVGEVGKIRGSKGKPVPVTLLDQPRPGWSASATIEALPNGTARLIGKSPFVGQRETRTALSRSAFRLVEPADRG